VRDALRQIFAQDAEPWVAPFVFSLFSDRVIEVLAVLAANV
jgi:hypothetical protein